MIKDIYYIFLNIIEPQVNRISNQTANILATILQCCKLFFFNLPEVLLYSFILLSTYINNIFVLFTEKGLYGDCKNPGI